MSIDVIVSMLSLFLNLATYVMMPYAYLASVMLCCVDELPHDFVFNSINSPNDLVFILVYVLCELYDLMFHFCFALYSIRDNNITSVIDNVFSLVV